MKSPNETIVAITGATGYLATHIIHDLLSQGYQVRGTVRNQENVASQHLTDPEEFCPEMKESGGTLTIYEADLTKENSFDECIDGADYVMHTASPCVFDASKIKSVKPIMETSASGIRNVLSAVEKTDSVKRVILTGSISATFDSPKDKKGAFNEDDWNTKTKPKHNVYFASKTKEEMIAWEIKEKATKNWELTALLGGALVGPSKHPRPSKGSYGFMIAMLSGIFRYGPNITSGMLDVSDFSKLHVLAMQHEKCFPRVMCSGEVKSLIEVGKAIKSRFGKKYPVTYTSLPHSMYKPFTSKTTRVFNTPFVPMLKHNLKHTSKKLEFDNSLLLENFDMKFSSVDQAIIDMAQSCVDNDMVPYRRKFVVF